MFFHAYGLAYVVAVAAAIIISRRRWARVGGDPGLCTEIAMWAFPAGVLGGRIYFDITTPSQIPPHWYGVFAVWDGGLGIWGGVAAGALVGLWVARRRVGRIELLWLMDAIAPAFLVAQAIGRIGNYFNQELCLTALVCFVAIQRGWGAAPAEPKSTLAAAGGHAAPVGAGFGRPGAR